MDIMSAVGRRSGVLSEVDLRELDDFANSDHFTDLERSVLQYTTEITNTPVRVDDENFEALKRHFSEKQLVELTATIVWENYRARFDHAFGIESSGFHED